MVRAACNGPTGSDADSNCAVYISFLPWRKRLVESGRFVAILPNSTLRFGAGRMQIKILPVRLRMKAPPIVAISLKNRTPNPIANLFIDELRAFAKPPMKGRPANA